MQSVMVRLQMPAVGEKPGTQESDSVEEQVAALVSEQGVHVLAARIASAKK